MTRALLEQYHAQPLLDFLDYVLTTRDHMDKKSKIDDLTDAFLMALQAAIQARTLYIKSKTPATKAERAVWVSPSGPVEAVGGDPGTRNWAMCHLELVDEEARPPNADGTPRAPHPLFIVHDWMLVDLLQPDKEAGTLFTIRARLPPPPATGPVVWSPVNQDIGMLISLQFDRQQAAKKRASDRAKQKRAEARAAKEATPAKPPQGVKRLREDEEEEERPAKRHRITQGEKRKREVAAEEVHAKRQRVLIDLVGDTYDGADD